MSASNRRRVRWQQRKRQLLHWRERARQLLFRPQQHHHFFIVTAAYNAQRYIGKTLRSVQGQSYPANRIEHLVINDASSDATAEHVRAWLRDAKPQHTVRLQDNRTNQGGCANYTHGFRAAPHDAIVLQLDGDDWLPDDGVLSYLNMCYHDPDLWITYNSLCDPAGTIALYHEELPEEVVADNSVRHCIWQTSHLHSFRAKLFSHVRDESLIDPETGNYWRDAVDQSHYLPMLELAGRHARHLPRITYTYNLNPESVLVSKREAQLGCEARIRALPPYQPLQRL